MRGIYTVEIKAPDGRVLSVSSRGESEPTATFAQRVYPVIRDAIADDLERRRQS